MAEQTKTDSGKGKPRVFKGDRGLGESRADLRILKMGDCGE